MVLAPDSDNTPAKLIDARSVSADACTRLQAELFEKTSQMSQALIASEGLVEAARKLSDLTAAATETTEFKAYQAAYPRWNRGGESADLPDKLYQTHSWDVSISEDQARIRVTCLQDELGHAGFVADLVNFKYATTEQDKLNAVKRIVASAQARSRAHMNIDPNFTHETKTDGLIRCGNDIEAWLNAAPVPLDNQTEIKQALAAYRSSLHDILGYIDFAKEKVAAIESIAPNTAKSYRA
jgi:hypothetical protein